MMKNASSKHWEIENFKCFLQKILSEQIGIDPLTFGILFLLIIIVAAYFLVGDFLSALQKTILF